MRTKTTEQYLLTDCYVAGAVGRAIKVTKDGKVYMIPISQVISYQPDRIVMTAWIAKQKGII